MEVNTTPNSLYYNDTLLHLLSDLRRETNLPIIIVMSFVMVVGILGNILLLIIYMYAYKRTPSNFYILSLAWVDLISCFICLPLQLNNLVIPYINDILFLCTFGRFVECFTNLSAGFILVSVASERYMKICHPLEPYEMRKARQIIVIVFVLSVSISWPQILVNDIHTIKVAKYEVIGHECSYNDSVNAFLLNGIIYLVYFVSLCVFVFFYTKILIVIVQRKRQLTQSMDRSRCNKDQDTKVKASRLVSVNGSIKMRASKTTLTLLTIGVAGFLGYVPFLTIASLRTSGRYLQTTLTPSGEYYHYGTSKIVDLVCNFFVKSYYYNSALNPIIYSIVNPAFRERMVQTLYKLKQFVSRRTVDEN